MNMDPEQKLNEPGGYVLVVDDDERTRHYETSLLELRGHTVVTAPDGYAALQVMEHHVPDVVLLDINMPELSGIEVCRKIKTNPATQHIPVILVTGSKERSDRLAGIDAGAVDFLDKPVDPNDLCLRVRNAIHMKRLFDQVQVSLEKQQKLEHMRDTMVQMLVHDMRIPLTSISMCLNFLGATAGKEYRTAHFAAKVQAEAGIRSLYEMVNSMLDVSRTDKTTMPLKTRSCLMSELVRDALNTVKPTLGRAMVVIDEPHAPITATCDPDLIRRVFVNLLSNAVHAMAYRGTVDVAIRNGECDVRITVTDRGDPIPAGMETDIFDHLAAADAKNAGEIHTSGLALPFCRLAVEAHGGTIEASSAPDTGNVFCVTLPKDEPVLRAKVA